MNESLIDTIAPKSDQLNADDLLTGPITVRVEAVKRNTSGQPIEIAIAGHRPYRPCKTMRRVLIAVWGKKGADWVGKSMTLYNDTSVKYCGEITGGIRISHLSHIENDITLLLTTTRSKRASYTVRRLDVKSVEYPQADFEKNLDAWVLSIKNGKITRTALVKRISAKGALSTAQHETLERAVTAKGKESQDNENK